MNGITDMMKELEQVLTQQWGLIISVFRFYFSLIFCLIIAVGSAWCVKELVSLALLALRKKEQEDAGEADEGEGEHEERVM
jgi:Flp pilus assembly protein TadB